MEKIKSNYKNFKDSFETEHFGKTFDKGVDKMRGKLRNTFNDWKDKSLSFIHQFVNKFDNNNDRP